VRRGSAGSATPQDSSACAAAPRVIGRVSSIKKRSSGLARLIEVKPFVRFSKLDKVLIIITPEPESVILKEAQ